MPILTKNWQAKLIVWLVVAVVLHGFLARIVDPLAAAAGLSVGRAPLAVAETLLLAAYTLGLFAFPTQFWRRAFKFACLMTPYMLLGPVLAEASTGPGASAGPVATGQIAGHLLALAIGFAGYKIAWPRLKEHAPRFNPAG